jgi:hypothetical protein
MISKIIPLIVFGVMVITTACSAGEIDTFIQDQTNTVGEFPTGEAIQLQQQGIGPLEITPPPPGESYNLAPASEGDGGNISSLGEQTTGSVQGGEAGKIESKAPGGLTVNGDLERAASWLTYNDQTSPFTINYPDTYTLLSAGTQSQPSGPRLLQQVRFLDRQLAQGSTADLEIPNFTIEIFDIENHSLETFLDTYFEQGVRQSFNLGSLKGIRVYFNQLIAPNEFYYFADQGLVFKLTPLGEYSQEMLDSFQIQP